MNRNKKCLSSTRDLFKEQGLDYDDFVTAFKALYPEMYKSKEFKKCVKKITKGRLM